MLRSLIVCCLLSVVGCAVEEEIAVETIPLPVAPAKRLVGDASSTDAGGMRAAAESSPRDLPPADAAVASAQPASPGTAAPVPTAAVSVVYKPGLRPITPPKDPKPSTGECEGSAPACGGAIGFCPEFRCVDGKWVSQPKERPRQGTCAGTLEACRGGQPAKLGNPSDPLAPGY